MSFARDAVLEAPGSLAAHVARGYLLVHSDQAELALHHLEPLAALAPESALLAFTLAEAHAAAGDSAASARALERARGLGDPSFQRRVENSHLLR